MIPVSTKAKRTTNPIRNIVDNLNPPKNRPKKLLNLALGDPTVYGNLSCPEVLNDTITALLAAGTPAARKAVAASHSTPGYEVNEDDVLLASGCSGAVDLAITALVNEGDNILVPKPCFPLYQVIVDSLGGKVKHYALLPHKNWECDLESMEKLIDSNTKAILINNPSNPCGSNFSPQHLIDIAAVARRHNLPIIADEIYGKCVFKGSFHAMHLYSGDVPVIALSGLAKEYIVPGWRVGWVVVHDKGTGRLKEVKQGMKSLTQIILGCCSLIQAALPALLTPAPHSKTLLDLTAHREHYMETLLTNSNICMELCKDCPYLQVIEPVGAMYVMIEVKVHLLEGIKDDADFAKQLLQHENVFMLPGQCFSMPNYVRLVICPPEEILREALERMMAFCESRGKVFDGEKRRYSDGVNVVEGEGQHEHVQKKVKT
eukprot:gene30806-37219_t